MKNFKWMWSGLLAVCFTLGAVPHAAEAAVSRENATYWDRSADTKMNIGAGLATYNGNTGWALNTGISRRIGDGPVFFALDLGMNFFSYSSNVVNTSTGATGISLMPGLLYGFGLGQVRGVHPYIGAAIGPQLYIERVNGAVAGAPTVSNTRVLLQVLVRPGANFPLGESFTLNVEPAFGVLNSNFIFLPHVSAVVAL